MFRYLFNQLVGRTARLILFLFAKPHLIGNRTAPPGPCVLVCNHTSHFDPPILSGFYPRKIDYMAMRDLFQHPAANFIFRQLDSFPVTRGKTDPEAVREAVARLKRGRIVGVFPEGGLRSGSTSIIGGAEPGGGAATLCQMAGVEMRVCLLIGSDQFYAWRNLFRKRPIYFLMGPTLRLDSLLPKREARDKLHREMIQSMRSLYDELLNTHNVPPCAIPRTAQERWATE